MSGCDLGEFPRPKWAPGTSYTHPVKHLLVWFVPAFLALAAADTADVCAQPKRVVPEIPRTQVKRATGPILVDGKLDDTAWKVAIPLPFVFPWDKQTGTKQKTIARLLWDDRNLYIAYDCDDSDVVAHHQRHDDPTYEDDAVEIFINPNPKQSFYYGLEMNARAVLYDYLFVFPKILIKRVDFSGTALATNIRGTLNQTGDKDRGWSLEVAIPWSNFEDLGSHKGPPAAGDTWTANLNRWDGTPPHRRLSQWSDSGLDDTNPHNPSRFGEIVFAD